MRFLKCLDEGLLLLSILHLFLIYQVKKKVLILASRSIALGKEDQFSPCILSQFLIKTL